MKDLALTTNDENVFVPHLGWMCYERGDAVLSGLRDGDFEYLEQAAFHYILRPGDIFLDCGAHCGLFTRLAASLVGPTGHVASIEPAPSTFDRLKRNTSDFSSELLSLHQIALGGTNRSVSFCSEGPGRAAFNHVNIETNAESLIQVTQVTLENFLLTLGRGPVDILKIDCEGQELNTLRAACLALKGRMPRLLMVEFNEENLRRYGGTCAALAGVLEEHGYHFFSIDPTRFELAESRPNEHESYANFFATLDKTWLRNRFATPSLNAKLIAAEILSRGAHVAEFKKRLYATIAEQTTTVENMAAETRRLSVREVELVRQLETTRQESQGHIDSLRSQLEQLATTARQQAAYIGLLENERSKLTKALVEERSTKVDVDDKIVAELNQSVQTVLIQTTYIASLEAERTSISQTNTRNLAESRRHIDSLSQQENFIAQLQSRLSEHDQTLSTLNLELNRLATIAHEQTAYIASLEAERTSISQTNTRILAESRRHIDSLSQQENFIAQLQSRLSEHDQTLSTLNLEMNRLAAIAQEQTVYIASLEAERNSLRQMASITPVESQRHLDSLFQQKPS